MGSISASIELYDKMSKPLHNIMNALNMTISSMYEMNGAMENGMNTSSLDAARESINSANASLEEMTQSASQLENRIEETSGSQNRFGSEVVKSTEQMNKLDEVVKKVAGSIGGMMVIKKVVDVIKDVTEASATQRVAETQLATTLSNMGGTKEGYNEIVSKAQEIQKAGMYGDEAMIGAAAEFATYMNDTSALELMMDTLTDYAAGMSGGRAVDYDAMVNYATNLGKITTGSYDAMTKKGFEFSEAQKAIIDGSATEEQYLQELGKGWKNMSDDMRTATVISNIIGESWANMYNNMSQTPEAKLESLKNTFGDIKEEVGNRLNVSLGKLYSIIADNMPAIENIMINSADILGGIIEIIASLTDDAVFFAQTIQDNWGTIAPIILGIVTALLLYKTIMGISSLVTGIAAGVHAMYSAAVTASATGQSAFNAALDACPITWIVIAVAALIALLFVLAQKLADASNVAKTGFGLMAGGINIVIQFFKNLGLEAANIGLGIWEVLKACSENVGTAFNNTISNVQSWFYGLLSTVLTVVAKISESLNSLPFIEFDYSGITSKAVEYAGKAAEAAGNKWEYTSLSNAFEKGSSTFDVFQSGWDDKAFNQGASWGDGVIDTVTNGIKNFGKVDIPQTDFPDQFNWGEKIAQNTDGLADTASSIADSVDVSNENLKYLRDVAEQEAINKFTTAEITVNQTNNNNVSGTTDVDGMVKNLTEGVNEALNIAAEGVHT